MEHIRSSEIIIVDYFCVHHKNRQKHNQHSELPFFKISLLFGTFKFSSHKQHLFGLLFSRNVKKTHTDQSILQTFLLSLKRSLKNL